VEKQRVKVSTMKAITAKAGTVKAKPHGTQSRNGQDRTERSRYLLFQKALSRLPLAALI